MGRLSIHRRFEFRHDGSAGFGYQLILSFGV